MEEEYDHYLLDKCKSVFLKVKKKKEKKKFKKKKTSASAL
jgi:hypothetical protein